MSSYHVDELGRLVWPSSSSNIWEVVGATINGDDTMFKCAVDVRFTIKKIENELERHCRP